MACKKVAGIIPKVRFGDLVASSLTELGVTPEMKTGRIKTGGSSSSSMTIALLFVVQ